MMKRKCKFCDTEFKTNYKSKLYCNAACQRGKTNPTPNRICKFCGKGFWHCKSAKLQPYCTRACFDKKQGRHKGINKKGFYVQHQDSYKQKIIPSFESPTGQAYIGIAKRPLMENKKGYGYQGVLLQDHTRQLVQCSACGEWFKKIGISHIKKCTGLTTEEYKKKYGLPNSQGLVSDETSLLLTANALKNKTIRNMKNIEKGYKNRSRKTTERKRLKAFKNTVSSMAWKNKYGDCPEQLKTRLKDFVLCNRELPGSGNRGRILYRALGRAYGNASKGFQHYGLPYRKRNGTNLAFEFPDKTIYKYNINQIDGREALFAMMKSKCELLN